MKERKKTELIDLIKQELKDAQTPPYREGAWEDFRTKYDQSPKTHPLRALWIASAVAAVLAVITVSVYKMNRSEPVNSNQIVHQEGDIKQKKNQQPIEHPFSERSERKINVPEHIDIEEKPIKAIESNDLFSFNEKHRDNTEMMTLPLARLQPVLHTNVENQLNRREFDQILSPLTGMKRTVPIANLDLGENMVLAERVDPYYANNNKSDIQTSPKRIGISDKLELGAFLSPLATGKDFNVGGGLVLAYQLNSKLAVRTGASFNQYEVGMLADELKGKDVPVETAEAPSDMPLLLSKSVPYRVNAMFLPNLNSVTGKVQTLDIPLELRYNLAKQFYATGGVSYAIVLSQERMNHYSAYTDVPAYSSASDSEGSTNKPVDMVEKTTNSSEDNVKSGFGGFVNFSLGKQTNVGKRMKVSVEPFIKLPVGQFKRADMNYTNGGLRIITHF